MLDFMSVIVGIMQISLSIGVAIKSDKNDNNNNNNNVGFQLLDLFIKELKSHMTCYNSMLVFG